MTIHSSCEALTPITHSPQKRRGAEHRCRRLRNGSPCCSTYGEAVGKVREAITLLLLSVLPNIPCLARWLESLSSLGWWALGMMCHGIFNRAFARAYPTIATALQVPAHLLEGNPDDVEDEQNIADEDWVILAQANHLTQFPLNLPSLLIIFLFARVWRCARCGGVG